MEVLGPKGNQRFKDTQIPAEVDPPGRKLRCSAFNQHSIPNVLRLSEVQFHEHICASVGRWLDSFGRQVTEAQRLI